MKHMKHINEYNHLEDLNDFINAIRAKNFDEVIKLIKRIDNINVPNLYGWIPIHIAAQTGDVSVIELLINNGADINNVGRSSKWTPLMYAASNGHFEAVEYIVELGVDINYSTGEQHAGTAIEKAMTNYHDVVFRYLLVHRDTDDRIASLIKHYSEFPSMHDYVQLMKDYEIILSEFEDDTPHEERLEIMRML